eukprot:Tbor_TRINITY_DN6163_c1_g2::TRINITY_DN6163_c1_g2_i1::g.22228::m.22228/K07555/ATPeAF1, ATPAF1, ATP11; ATP synthase mitochondrial F1 complex assembly factor 1
MLRRSNKVFGFYKTPGRKSLSDICKVDLMESTPPAHLSWVWNEHHKQYPQYWGRTISTAAYQALQPRLIKSPYFIIPVFRDKGLFNVVVNFHNDIVGVTPLREFQEKQDNASINMTIQFFSELSRSKNMVLVRCEIQDKVFVKQDTMFITQMILKYYTIPRLYEQWVETFNKRPNQFDYHQYLRAMKDEAKKDNIKIEDKKYDYRLGDKELGCNGGLLNADGTPLVQDLYGPVIDVAPEYLSQRILESANDATS